MRKVNEVREGELVDKLSELNNVVNDIMYDMERGKITPSQALRQLKMEFKSIDLRKARVSKNEGN